MTLNQISVFLENKPGKLQQLTDILAKHSINMRALSLAETSDFGIVRIIVDDLAVTSEILKGEEFIYTVTKVLGVAIPDEPGGLNRVIFFTLFVSTNKLIIKHEMADMFDKQVYAYLAERTGGCIASRYIRIYGMGESAIAQLCAKWIESDGEVTVAPYCSLGECQLRVTARGDSETAAIDKVLPVVRELLSLLGESAYAVTED